MLVSTNSLHSIPFSRNELDAVNCQLPLTS